MLDAVLKLLPLLPTVIAATDEFADLIAAAKKTLSTQDQQLLQDAYELAKVDSDKAHAELQSIVAARS